jgi:hypothetical protein
MNTQADQTQENKSYPRSIGSNLISCWELNIKREGTFQYTFEEFPLFGDWGKAG